MRVLTTSVAIIGIVASTGGGATSVAATNDERSPRTARAALKDASGRTAGDAALQETPHGVLLKVEFRDVPPGTHAFHIHEIGRCDAPSFESAGGHYASDGRAHGFLDGNGPHAGDLPNVHVPESGRLSVEYLVARVTLGDGSRSLFDQNGSALILHRSGDDYRTEPAGDAGVRLACGVIERG